MDVRVVGLGMAVSARRIRPAQATNGNTIVQRIQAALAHRPLPTAIVTTIAVAGSAVLSGGQYKMAYANLTGDTDEAHT